MSLTKILSNKKILSPKIGVLVLSILFIGLNSYLISTDFLYLNYLPFLLIGVILLVVFPEKFYFTLIFLTPLSIPLSEYIGGLDFDFWVPTEPLILFFLLLIIAKSLINRNLDLRLTNHPVFWAILFYLGWLLITSFGSVMPVVSFKYTLVRVWFIVVFFYIAYLFFLRNSQNFWLYAGGYLGGLLVVILISLNTQYERGLFSKFSAHGACNPYFTDHTSYGAAIAFVIPIVVSFIFVAKTKKIKWLLTAFALFLTSALVLSYSRAAWLSLIFGIGIWFVWWLKIKIRTILLITLTLVALAFTFQDRISWWLNNNQTASSGNLQEHLHSIANIKTDDSNVERLNRWVSAVRMIEEKPNFGWGPGTYMFQYAPYQPSFLKTNESSNLGQKGNAHSEYLGLMAEAGWPGVLGYVLILLLVFYRGFKLLKLNTNFEERLLVLGALIGLSTYVFHGILNNFLDMDKIAAIFWGYIAFIVAMDVKYRFTETRSQE